MHRKHVRLMLPSLHHGQTPIVYDPHRIVVAAMGSKFGKTWCMTEWLALEAWNNPGYVCRWIAPTFRQGKIAFRQMGLYFPPSRVRTLKADLVYELIRSDGSAYSRIEFVSADNPDSIRGEGVHACVADEMAFWSEEAYRAVWTTLTRTRGKLRMISTPKGRSFFYDEWCKGWYEDKRKNHLEYSSYQLPTWVNPHVPREAIYEFKRNMPADVFRQEICAEFLDDSAGVFHNIKACQTATWRAIPDNPARPYVMGIDWAKHNDFTVFTVADAVSKAIVYIERHTGLDWNEQIASAVRSAKRWNNAQVLMDSTGVGDVPFDLMRAVYPSVAAYNIFNNHEKVALVQRLQFALERKELQLPRAEDHQNARVLQGELERYGFSISGQGRYLFSAPEGEFDDCVMSACLANWALQMPAREYRFRSVPGV